MAPPEIIDRLKPDTTYKVAYGENVEDLENPCFIIGYWSIRGLAAPLRMMLAAAEVSHWVALYDVTEEMETGDWKKESYLADKEWLKEEFNPLMNCPFLIVCGVDDGRVIVQTNAILQYLGRELNMLGDNPEDQIKCEELLCEVMDIRNQMVRYAYAPSIGNDKSEAEILMKPTGAVCRGFDKFEDYLIRNETTFLVGDTVTAPDFHLWEMMDQCSCLNRHYQMEALFSKDKRERLFSFYTHMGIIPSIKSYIDSELIKDLPFNNPYARYGSRPGGGEPYIKGAVASWHGKGVVTIQRSGTMDIGQKRKR